MNDDSRSPGDSLPVEALQRMDQACLRFEAEWQAGRRPRLEDFLDEAAEPERMALFRELLRLEVHYRWTAGEKPTVAEYESRFPSGTAIIQQVFSVAHVSTVDDRRSGSLPDVGVAAPVIRVPALPVVPNYEIQRELGRGGMGVVYQARQVKANRVVALKMILAGAHADEASLARFKTEAEAIARLQPPHIVQIHEVGEHDGLPFFSLEFCPGGSLDKKLKGTPLPSREAASLVQTLAAAMQAAHDRGVIHRDLKPANILLASGGREPPEAAPSSGGSRPPLAVWVPKITDFGLAKKLDESDRTPSGAVMGSPSYMAPEQAAGKSKEIGPAADTYALGAILYECLTGRPPFKAATVMDTLMQVIADEPVPLRRLNHQVPLDLETICLKCLQKEPGKRYASAAALADDLCRFQNGEPIAARPVGTLERGWRWCKRKPVVAGLLGAVAAVLLLGATISTALAIRSRSLFEWGSQQSNDLTIQKGLTEDHKTRADEVLKQKQEQEVKTKELENFTDRQSMTKQLLRVAAVYERDPGLGLTLLYDDSICPIHLRDTTWRFYERACSRWELATLAGHTDKVYSVVFSPDGQTLASASADQTVGLWDVLTGQPRATLTGHPGSVSYVAFSPNGQHVVGCDSGSNVRTWTVKDGEPTSPGQLLPITRTQVTSPDGTFRAEARNQVIWLFDLKNFNAARERSERLALEPIRRAEWHQQQASQAEKDQKWFAAAFHLGQLTKDKPTDADFPLRRDQALQKLSPDQRQRLLTPPEVLANQDVIPIAPPAKRTEPLTVKGHTGMVTGVAFSLDGRRLASSSGDQTVRIWNADQGQEVHLLRGHTAFVHGVAFSPDGKRLASGSTDKTVKVWDAAKGVELLSITGHTLPVNCVCFSPDGRFLASGGGLLSDPTSPGEVKIWDAQKGQEFLALKGHTLSVYSVCFSPDGKRLASASADQTVRVWDTQTGQELLVLQGHTDVVRGVCFSPDGKRLASASGVATDLKKPGEAKVWDLEKGVPLFTLNAHTGPVTCVAFSPDGESLATGSGDTTVKLWDPQTGKELFTLTGHTKFVRCVAFSPDGKRLASGSGDFTVKVWDVSSIPEAPK